MDQIGRYVAVPATRPYGDRLATLRLDLCDPRGLAFNLDGEARFVVSRDAMQSMLERYDELTRLREACATSG
jgi:hypothetical protein